MKSRYILLFLLSGLLLITGCQKFLDKRPNDDIDRSSFYKTPADFELAVQTVYRTLPTLYSGAYGYNGWCADEAFGSRSTFVVPGTYNLNASSSYYSGYWNSLYQGIKEANILLDAMDKNPDVFSGDTLSMARGKMIRGETMFLRGYYYYMLVQLFGGVPLRLASIDDVNNMDLQRSSVKEVYDQVLKDMRFAEDLVPDIRKLGYSGRVSKSAVRGILARVNLTMAGHPLMETSRFDSARYWAAKVINDGVAGHQLNPQLPQFFKNLAADVYEIDESIWEVEYAGDNLNALVNVSGNIGCFQGPASNNPETGYSRGYTGITRKSALIFGNDAGDMRKWFNIAWFNYNATGPNGAKTYKGTSANNSFWYGFQPGKFRREWETHQPKGGFSATPINFPILRFADVLLMYAEADNEINGPTPQAIEYINRIRQRAWSTGIADNGISVTNQGGGYSSANPPAVTISGGGGGGARAVATVSSAGRVTAVTMLMADSVLFWTRGSGYSGIPTVTIAPPPAGGTQATAVVTAIYNKGQANVPASATAGKEAFRAFIQDERFRELYIEANRKFDLLRWGMFLDVMAQMAINVKSDYNGSSNYITTLYANVTPRDTLWPIPLNEITANPLVAQNPGWY